MTLLLSGCVDSRIQTAPLVPRTVPAGATVRLGHFAFLNPDCSFGGYAEVRALSPPAHGTFAIQQGEDYTNYAANNQRYDCNKQKSRLIEVMYTPAVGYHGADEFVMLAIYPNGSTATSRYTITVE
jgi:hypothetical protein